MDHMKTTDQTMDQMNTTYKTIWIRRKTTDQTMDRMDGHGRSDDGHIFLCTPYNQVPG